MAQIFPRWTNDIPSAAVLSAGFGGLIATVVIWVWWSPWHTDVGYAPVQPIEYSHALHAGDLQIDCRYCHSNVEKSSFAGVPPTQTCLNCHNVVKADSPKLEWLRKAKLPDGKLNPDAPSTPWKRIHKVPDYAVFDHSAHLAVGVGCVSCHGRVDQMVVVAQRYPLSMTWCLDCHRDVRHYDEGRRFEPADVLRPLDKVPVTDMTWGPKHEAHGAWREGARALADKLKPPTVECTGCHR